jgi:hypothetical protein
MLSLQNKEGILKAVREEPTYLQRKHIRIISALSTELLKAKKAWDDILKALKVNNS